jgi:maltose/moltooligosaccharide transporter
MAAGGDDAPALRRDAVLTRQQMVQRPVIRRCSNRELILEQRLTRTTTSRGPGWRPVDAIAARPSNWRLGLGAFGLAWMLTSVTTYVPAELDKYLSSSTLIGLVLASEALVALTVPLAVGPMTDRAGAALARRRTMLLAVAPLAGTLTLIGFASGTTWIAVVLVLFFVAYYVYEPPYRGLYADLVPLSDFGRSQGIQNMLRGGAIAGALIGGGLLFDLWRPSAFLTAAVIGPAACVAAAKVITGSGRAAGRPRPSLLGDLSKAIATVKANVPVRRYLLASAAWEFTFAGMRTFVVLYFVRGLGQPARTSTAVLVVVALGYLAAAIVATRLSPRIRIGNVIAGASLVYGGGLSRPASERAGIGCCSSWSSLSRSPAAR